MVLSWRLTALTGIMMVGATASVHATEVDPKDATFWSDGTWAVRSMPDDRGGVGGCVATRDYRDPSNPRWLARLSLTKDRQGNWMALVAGFGARARSQSPAIAVSVDGQLIHTVVQRALGRDAAQGALGRVPATVISALSDGHQVNVSPINGSVGADVALPLNGSADAIEKVSACIEAAEEAENAIVRARARAAAEQQAKLELDRRAEVAQQQVVDRLRQDELARLAKPPIATPTAVTLEPAATNDGLETSLYKPLKDGAVLVSPANSDQPMARQREGKSVSQTAPPSTTTARQEDGAFNAILAAIFGIVCGMGLMAVVRQLRQSEITKSVEPVASLSPTTPNKPEGPGSRATPVPLLTMLLAFARAGRMPGKTILIFVGLAIVGMIEGIAMGYDGLEGAMAVSFLLSPLLLINRFVRWLVQQAIAYAIAASVLGFGLYVVLSAVLGGGNVASSSWEDKLRNSITNDYNRKCTGGAWHSSC